jgi:catechol 2,3-dioxygenase-like lactoylglutathione lyase family enzyme
MTNPPIPVPIVDCQRHHTTAVVADIQSAIDFYTKKLGFSFSFIYGEPPRFAGVMLDEVQIFLLQGTPQPDGFEMVFMVGNADELYEFHKASGVRITEEIGDREYDIRDYGVVDLDGNHLVFGHPLYDAGPKIEIERVDVPVRLEKRLAALLYDLAKHKRMSLGSCLEEILLHTNEPLGDGVASPHTKSDLRYIQELKKKHGIDYDSHASYRFVEKP